MKKTETIALRVLLLFCLSCFIQGEEDLSAGPNKDFTITSTSSPPQRSSAANPESQKATLPSTSSEGDVKNVTNTSANETLNQQDDETANNTAATGFPSGSAGPTVNTPAHFNSTSVPENLTYSQDSSNRDNQTSTASNTTLSTTTTIITTTTTTALPTSASSTHSQTPSASTRPQNTTNLPATTTPNRGTSSNVTLKSTSASTAASTNFSVTTILPAKFSSAPVPPGTPSELNVGDDTASSSKPMDPLLAGLVSVFVVTAAVVSLLIFLKLRRRNERPEFRRLQDLPMDDMMEDTPLSMYSY